MVITDEMDKFTQGLMGIFHRYKFEKRILNRLYHRTGQTFLEVKKLLQRNITDERFKESLDKVLMYHDTLHKVKRVMSQSPCIIFIGQTKSGKSSLINELLEATVVTVDQRPCTARLVQLEYAEREKCVMLVDKNGNTRQKMTLTKNHIPSKLINLPNEQRIQQDMIEQRVIAQVKNPFLESGVKIVDSPGQDENPLLDDLVLQHLHTILPLIVYVIDGRNFVTTKDVEDIKKICDISPSKNIFFVVSKIECEGVDYSSEDSEEEGTPRLSLEERQRQEEVRIMRSVYHKLCKEGILDPKVKLEDCGRLYGLSARKIKDYRWRNKERRQQGKSKLKPDRYVESFEIFKEQLVKFSEVQLNYFVDSAAETLAKIHQGCINFFIDEANRIYNDSSNYDKFISKVRDQEAHLVLELYKKIQEEQPNITEKITDFLKKIRSIVIHDAGLYEYKEAKSKVHKDFAKVKNSSSKGPLAKKLNAIGHRHQRGKTNSLYSQFEKVDLPGDPKKTLDWCEADCEDITKFCIRENAKDSEAAGLDRPKSSEGPLLQENTAEPTTDVGGTPQKQDAGANENEMSENWEFLEVVREHSLVSDMRAVMECENQLRRFTREKIGLGLSNMIWDELIHPGGILDILSCTAKSFDIGRQEDDPATVLKNLIHEHYEYRYNPEIEKMEMHFKKSIRACVKKFLTSLTDISSGGIANIPVNQRNWKEEVARQAFEGIHGSKVAEEIVNLLREHVEEGHEQFIGQQEDINYIYHEQCRIGGQNRGTIRECAPQIAELELRSLDLIYSHRYGRFKGILVLGEGAQGRVELTNLKNHDGDPIVVKRRVCNNIPELQTIALEVHHTRNVKHSNLAELYGCVIKYEYDDRARVQGGEVCLFYRKEEGDLRQLICLGLFPKLKDRLEIALKVAEAVKYLHEKEMTHRDIKCENVLVDRPSNRVVLADYGYLKPYGLTNKTLCGAPFHMAPELHEGTQHCPEVDVYAFGVLLWYIVDGTGRDPFTVDRWMNMEEAVKLIFRSTQDGRRPPLLDSYPRDCCALMEASWDQNPKRRPSILNIVEDLKKIIAEMDVEELRRGQSAAV